MIGREQRDRAGFTKDMAKNKKFKFKTFHLLVFALFLFILSFIVASKGGLSEIVNLNRQNKTGNKAIEKDKQSLFTALLHPWTKSPRFSQSLNRIKISGVEVADFTKEISQDESPSYYTIAKTADYHIFFMPADELFFISITSYPFDEHRGVAEQKLLEVLAISEDDACKLNVDITTPAYANPDKAGKVYDLSFCSNNN